MSDRCKNGRWKSYIGYGKYVSTWRGVSRKEVTDPTRIVTTTVRVADGKVPMINVKTEHDIPKDKIFDCIAALAA